ncbi:MAG TPA: L,D-transpeptidase [Candidatus Acidoferrales bacterium]|nr:L,D-transpeptidase [Candidatus Acidoferrales bacterium]
MRRTRTGKDFRGTKLCVTKRVPAALVLLTLAFTVSATAQEQPRMRCDNAESAPAATERRIVVSIPDRKLAVVENGRVVLKFAISVGAPESPSPAGEFRVINRVENPVYYHPGDVIPARPDNPVGPRWIGLSIKGYGIHGTNEPRLIGRDVSHGCIRLRNRDVKRLFARVRVGDVVELHATRDAQTARYFGTDLPHVLLASALEQQSLVSPEIKAR